ncbi:RadC family protein [Liquorilactobacillus vini]|uniref:RadC family protein n=1 Tax=Liquorilactobacillus vini TaxID=238015 RepID=UPI0002DD2AB5|nr:DNA repair protein RadC [Liquorilactobacillus vini]
MNETTSLPKILHKAKTFSPAALTDQELLYLTLNKILNLSISLQQLNEICDQEFDLRQLKYFSEHEWKLLFKDQTVTWKGKVLCELASRIEKRPKFTLGRVTSSQCLGQQLIEELGMLQQEVLLVLVLDTKNQVLGRKVIFRGTLDAATVHPREIFNFALRYSAARLIIVHNHPSGDPTPSTNDLNLTNRLKKCGDLMGIQLLDHLIVGSLTYLSFQEERLLD